MKFLIKLRMKLWMNIKHMHEILDEIVGEILHELLTISGSDQRIVCFCLSVCHTLRM